MEKIDAPTPPVGVIESLSAGFETVAGRLVLILLPLLLDLFLWTGPRLSIRPAVANYYDEIWQPTVAVLDDEMQESFADVSRMIAAAAEDMPALYLPLLGIPTLMAGREAAAPPLDYSPPVWEVHTLPALVGVNLLALAVGLLIAGVYVALIAAQVRDGYIDLGRVVSRLPINLLWLGIFGIALPIIFLIIYVPFLLLAAGFSLISGFLALLMDWAGRLLVLWVAMFLIFTIHGIMMNERGLLKSIWDSIRLVQWNMPATVFLMVLVVVLNAALTYIWTMAPAGSWMAVIAMVGHAFIATGLITATFVYFKDRYRYWREMRSEIIAELERQRARHK